MNVNSELWLIAGPNGAGKSTLTQRGPFAKNLKECVFLNSDDQTLQQIRQLGFEGFQDVPTTVWKQTSEWQRTRFSTSWSND